jgi:hypothetical protein
MVFIGGVRRCCAQRLGAWSPLVRPANRPCNLVVWPSFLLALPLGIVSLEHRLCWTRRQNGFWKCTNTWLSSQGDVAGRPHLGLVESMLCATSFPHVILSVTMPYFGHNEDMHGFLPYSAFQSSDVPGMVDQRNSWNSLIISTYLLYLE